MGTAQGLSIERPLMNARRLLREVEDGFVAQVRVRGDFQPSQNSTTKERLPFVGAGLVLMKDDKTYIRLERAALRFREEVKRGVSASSTSMEVFAPKFDQFQLKKEKGKQPQTQELAAETPFLPP